MVFGFIAHPDRSVFPRPFPVPQNRLVRPQIMRVQGRVWVAGFLSGFLYNIVIPKLDLLVG